VRRTVTVRVGDFSLESLEGPSAGASTLSRDLVQAIRYYLADERLKRAGWVYPAFRRDGSFDPSVEVQVEVDELVWRAFAREAERQDVSTDQLLQHAVLYFAADRDDGRLAQRIVEDLDG
jgi:hypothetical protein